MAQDFARAVDDGLKLSKRIYFGKDRAVAPPKPPMTMDTSVESYLPTAPMVYAVIGDPGIVDNPDIPSYQPHVHGRLDPPALIPLQMNRVELVADCYLNTAFVRLTGSWRVHCVMGSRSCDCRIAIPMGDQGSILGVEVDIPRKSYNTQLISIEDNNTENIVQEDGGFLTPHIFTFTVPQVSGGTNLSIQIRWSQKLSFSGGQLSLSVPFTFPEYVIPAGKKMSKKECIKLNVNAGTDAEVLCNTISHPLKELRRQAGRLSFSYEADVLSWSKMDFTFSYSIWFQVSSAHAHGGVFLQSSSVHDSDQREMFSIYIYPGNRQSEKVFRKEIVYVVDISGSMRGKALEDVKNALFAAISDLDPEDSFNIVAFNNVMYLFSTSMEIATKENVERSIQWIGMNFVAGGGTNILLPLTKAIEMLSNESGSFPLVLLITDGSVEDERHICDVIKNKLAQSGSFSPRIYTYGIGLFCNHYFLKMLAILSKGRYDAAYHIDSIGFGLKKFISVASSAVLADITLGTLNDIEEIEVYPSTIPDLSHESLLIISGRYQGQFPDIVEAQSLLPDSSNFTFNLKVHQAKDIPLDQLIATEHIAQLTALAWLSENKQLQEKIGKLSIQTGVISEYTQMTIVEVDRSTAAEKEGSNQRKNQKMAKSDQTMTMLKHLGIGFGDLTATAENIIPGAEEARLPEAAEIFVKAASSCCSRLCSHCCCCPCCIAACSHMNNQCAIVLTQLCTALACFGCFDCCFELCCSTNEGA